MFGKAPVAQSKPLNLSIEEIIEDIEAVYLDEQQRNKLYVCLDHVPPHNDQLAKVEGFMNSTDNLEDIKKKLDLLIRDVEGLVNEVNKKVASIQKTVTDYSRSTQDL